MADSHGRFIWYELTTTDMQAAKAFYAAVVGWGTRDASMKCWMATGSSNARTRRAQSSRWQASAALGISSASDRQEAPRVKSR
jgi:hypothetical protein